MSLLGNLTSFLCNLKTNLNYVRLTLSLNKVTKVYQITQNWNYPQTAVILCMDLLIQRESATAVPTPQCVRTPHAVNIWLQSSSDIEGEMVWIKREVICAEIFSEFSTGYWEVTQGLPHIECQLYVKGNHLGYLADYFNWDLTGKLDIRSDQSGFLAWIPL